MNNIWFTGKYDMFSEGLADQPNVWPIVATNCIGVMGTGQAGAYGQWDPRGKAHYKYRCRQQYGHEVGGAYMLSGDKGRAISLPTMHLPGTRLANHHLILDGLISLGENLNTFGYQCMTEGKGDIWLLIPRLGCGIGGLTWEGAFENSVLDVLDAFFPSWVSALIFSDPPQETHVGRTQPLAQSV